MNKEIEIGMRIKQRRLELDLTQEELGERLNLNKSTIQRYESGAISKIKLPVLQAIAKQLNVDPDWLALKTDNMGNYSYSETIKTIPLASGEDPQKKKDVFEYNPTHKIPILGRISAGLPLYAEEHVEGYIYTELNGGNEYFGLRVKGDSMTAARICEGDIIIVRKQETVEDGEIAVVMVGDDDATVKRFHKNGSTVMLTPQSYNPEHKTQVYDLRETNIRIVGKVIRVQYDV